jgi:DNA-binding transcriptional MocR family regulator
VLSRINKTDFAYQMVYRYLSRLTNELPGGPAVKLPSLRLLARRLRVSISTVQNAVLLQIVNDYVKNNKYPRVSIYRASRGGVSDFPEKSQKNVKIGS